MYLNLQYSESLYLGNSINQAKLSKIKNKLERKPLFAGVYLLTISKNQHDQLDIIKSVYLNQQYFVNNTTCVVGITKYYDEAIAIVEKIVLECLKSRGDCKLKEYLYSLNSNTCGMHKD